MGAFSLSQQGRTWSQCSPPSNQLQAEWLKLFFVPVPGEDFVDIPENFFVGGEEDITIQTVTWPDVELPLPRNITEGEARGTVILTVKPIFHGSPTALEPEEPFTLAPDMEATTIPEAENGTEEATRPWAFPEESTPGLGPATAFTSEDLVVQVTIAPGAAEIPGQPRLPGGKYLLPGGLHGARGGWRELGLGVCTLHLTWDLGPGTGLSPLTCGSPWL